MNELCDYIKLQQSGKPYPRSCPECQLGPCKHPIKSLDAQPVKLPAMPMEIQEWCWHLDTAMEQDARHQAMALGSAWPVISKWLRSVVGHAKQSVKAFDAQPVPVINERQEWLHTPECLVGDECSCFTVTPKQPVPVEPDYLIRLRNALKGFKSDGAFAGDKDIVDYIDSLQSALKLAQGLAEVPKIRLIADQADVNRPAPSAPQSSQPDTVAVPMDYKELYLDLIMQVGKKWPDESRHDTAKRYIIKAETGIAGVGAAQEGK